MAFENEKLDANLNTIVELSDEDLENIAGGAQLPETRPCPNCGGETRLKGSGDHYVYFCKKCREAFNV